MVSSLCSLMLRFGLEVAAKLLDFDISMVVSIVSPKLFLINIFPTLWLIGLWPIGLYYDRLMLFLVLFFKFLRLYP